MKRRVLNLLISLDQFILSLITLGGTHPDMTISGACYKYGMLYPKPLVIYCMYFVDGLFSLLETDHCKKSYENESIGVKNYGVTNSSNS